MLTEEAHHMFVGETGVQRTVQRTADVMGQLRTDDPARLRAAGVIDLPTLQRYINLHFVVSLDLFGREISTNAATYFAAGLKGRYQESRINDDHRLVEATWDLEVMQDGRLMTATHPARNALNERLRRDYIADCRRGLDRWNRTIRDAGVDFELCLPHQGFSRQVGAFAGAHLTPDGQVISASAWEAARDSWLPTADDDAFVDSLMGRVVAAGEMASWIGPPTRGINGKPVDFEYVRFA
jgi:benzoyl-CoA 2,3-dioxygenase component B